MTHKPWIIAMEESDQLFRTALVQPGFLTITLWILYGAIPCRPRPAPPHVIWSAVLPGAIWFHLKAGNRADTTLAGRPATGSLRLSYPFASLRVPSGSKASSNSFMGAFPSLPLISL